MKISYNWLRNYIDADITLDETLRVLTDIGLEVDGAEKTEAIKGGLEGVVVGKVLTCSDHPDSDHLHITTVDIGAEEPIQVVCGASNVAAGQKVLVATVGANLYPIDSEDAFKIKKSRIRGVDSFGMICAEDELGIGHSHDGIMVLADDAVVGTSARDFLKLEDDVTIEIGLTPNRVDAASHYGVARDLTAYIKTQGRSAGLILPDVSAYSQDENGRAIRVKVENSEAAPRYAGVTICGVKIAPSPEWMQNSLRAIGINPKNNVVDITNFVLHELGQPLHAFDADKIEGGEIVVRAAKEGVKFTTLDGVERTLSDQDLMICDSRKEMCIAGVMGGIDSGVTEQTTSLFIESAYFDPVWIRKSAKRHGINSDSSFRFERGIDPDITIMALKRAALLIKEYAGGRITSDITDIYPNPIGSFRFELSLERMNRLIGKEIPADTVKRILGALEVKIESENGSVWSVAVPPYRVDVRREADLVEDILRLYGYNNVEIPEHVNSTLSYEPRHSRDRLTGIVADSLSANGFTETMSNSLTKVSYYEGLETYKAENCVRILNPLSNDLNVMRQTLLFNAMETISLNTNHRNSNLKIYEFGNVYKYNVEKASEGGLAPYSENYRLAVAVTGLKTAQSWNTKVEPTDFFTLKSVAEKLLKRLGLNIYGLKCDTISNELISEGISYASNNGKELLYIGIVSKSVRKTFDVKAEVYYMDIDFDALMKATRKNKITVSDLPKFPEVRRDLALLVDKSVTFRALREAAYAAERKLLRDVGLFDIYEGDKLPEGKKSYALSFVLRDDSKTLTDQIIDKTMANLARAFEERLGATVRS